MENDIGEKLDRIIELLEGIKEGTDDIYGVEKAIREAAGATVSSDGESPERLEFRPVMKPSDTGAPASCIYFDEWVQVPKWEAASVSIRFDRENSFEDVKKVIAELKRRGVTIVIEKANPA